MYQFFIRKKIFLYKFFFGEIFYPFHINYGNDICVRTFLLISVNWYDDNIVIVVQIEPKIKKGGDFLNSFNLFGGYFI